MDSQYPGYYIDQSKLQSLSEKGYISLDSNMLLDMYRISDSSADEILSVLESLSSRLIITHQVRYEYHKNIHTVLKHQIQSCTKLKSNLNANILDLKNFEKSKSYPYIGNELINSLNKETEKIINILDKQEEEIWEKFQPNHLRMRIGNLIESSSLCIPKNDEDISNIDEIGAQRYEQEVPPGYKDAKKTENKYGDLHIWFELINCAKERKSGIIHVTSDVKEDWFLEINGRKLGPRPELINEFHEKTGELFYLYTPQQFMKHVVESPINEEVKKELDYVEKNQIIINIEAFKEALEASKPLLVKVAHTVKNIIESIAESEEVHQIIEQLQDEHQKKLIAAQMVEGVTAELERQERATLDDKKQQSD